jgi:putative transcriptional regulator
MKNNLRIERALLNVTQADLAAKVKVSRQTINSIEAGRYVPSSLLALKIAHAFQKPVATIFKIETRYSPSSLARLASCIFMMSLSNS